MFVQITNSQSTSKVGAVKSPSPERSFVQGRKFDVTETNVDESVVELSANSESVIAAQPMSGFDEQKSAKSKSERMLEKLGEKASKFRPKKFFGGEKEPEQPGIYTIDREMGRTNRAFDHDEGRSSPGIQSPVRGYISPARRISQTAELEVVMRQSELTDRLKRTRQNSPSSPINSAAKATDLRLVSPENKTDWMDTISKYTRMTSVNVREALVNTYDNQLPFWTFPGSLMFCVSLLTTLDTEAGFTWRTVDRIRSVRPASHRSTGERTRCGRGGGGGTLSRRPMRGRPDPVNPLASGACAL
ncbi:unnamed protein product, partial [Nesidiocoris tenuis]